MRRIYNKCDKCERVIEFPEVVEAHFLHLASDNENTFTLCNTCFVNFLTEFMGLEIRNEQTEETAEVENNETE